MDFLQTVTRAYGLAWRRYRTFARTMGPPVVGAMLLVIVGLAAGLALGLRHSAAPPPNVGLPLLVMLVAFVLAIVLEIFAALVGIRLADDLLAGESPSVSSVWQRARGRFWNLVATGLLIAGAIILPAFVVGLAFAASPPLGFFLSLGYMVLVFYLALRWMLAAAASVLETRSPRANLARSAELTRGSRLVIFGVILVMGAVSGTLTNILGRLAFLGSTLSSLFIVSRSPTQLPIFTTELMVRLVVFLVAEIFLQLFLVPASSVALVSMFRDLSDGAASPPPPPGPEFVPAPVALSPEASSEGPDAPPEP